MTIWPRLVLCFAFAANLGFGQVPSFDADGVLPADGKVAAPLAPGMLVSIYGYNLGPAMGCRSGYPTELCDTQVLVSGTPAGLLFAQERQINFQVPHDIPAEGTVEIQVIYKGLLSQPVKVRASRDPVAISLESPAKVGMPVWLKVWMPGREGTVHYPYGVRPGNFGCHEIEVRRDGKILPRIATRDWGGSFGGLGPCGFLGLRAESHHIGRIPLHLQYRFDQPGIYEVRYTMRVDDGLRQGPAEVRSAWTQIEILPGDPVERAEWLKELSSHAPGDMVELLTDFLPDILGIPDKQSLDLLCGYLYNPDREVRRFAMYGLGYWPDDETDAAVWDAMRRRGPSDVSLEYLTRRPEVLARNAGSIVAGAVPYLRSDDLVLLGGAVAALYHIGFQEPTLNPAIRARAEAALIEAAEHIVRVGDEQIATEYACALGVAKDERARGVLWNFVSRNVRREQAIIALTWRHAPADLPRLAELALAPANGHDSDRELAVLPYSLHRGYGDAAIFYLETMLDRSEFTLARTSSARELVLAGRAAGFRYMADAVENIRPYRRDMLEFVRGQFPELSKADDGEVLKFLRARASQ